MVRRRRHLDLHAHRHGQLDYQAKPTSDTTTVDGSGAYTTPLAVTGNNGTVSYTATGATRHTF